MIEVAVKTATGEVTRFYDSTSHTQATAEAAARDYMTAEGFDIVDVTPRTIATPMEIETRRRTVQLVYQLVEKGHCFFWSDQKVLSIAHPDGCDAFLVEEAQRLGPWFHELADEAQVVITKLAMHGTALWPEGPHVRFRSLRGRLPQELRTLLTSVEPVIAALLMGVHYPQQEVSLG